MEKEKGMKGQKISFAKSGLVILCLALLLASLEIRSEDIAYGAQTTGGVNWIDPLGYTKPAFSPITVPDEASCPNKYYIDLNSGTGTTCSLTSPCKTFKDLSGKAGISGGPAYIYIRGSGSFQWDSNYPTGSNAPSSMYGSAGKEIVIKPWGGSTASLTYNLVLDWSSASSSHQYIIWDGGPNMAITFFAGPSQYNGAWNFERHVSDSNLSNWTFYRCQWRVGSTSGQWFRAYGRSANINFINNEFYDAINSNNATGHQFYISTADSNAAYPGDCASGDQCAAINYVLQNNIFRDSNNCVEVNVRSYTAPYTVDGLTIMGNAIHNCGKDLCSTSWACRPGITLSNTSSGNPQWRNVNIQNNLIWDIASSGIWTRAGNPLIYNNTIYDYGKGSGGGGPNPQGISGYNNGGSATVKDNIIYAPNGTAPFDGSAFVKSNNVCSGSGCVTYNSGTLLSTDPNSIGFLKIGANSNATNGGVNLNISTDYRGAPRLNLNGAYDSGAFAYSAEQPAPAPPVLMGVQ